MQLTPWIKPFRRDLTRSNREMNSLWNDFLGELRPFEEFGEEWLPSIDVTENDSELTDIWALKNGYISVVPSQHDLTSYPAIAELKYLEKITG